MSITLHRQIFFKLHFIYYIHFTLLIQSDKTISTIKKLISAQRKSKGSLRQYVITSIIYRYVINSIIYQRCIVFTMTAILADQPPNITSSCNVLSRTCSMTESGTGYQNIYDSNCMHLTAHLNITLCIIQFLFEIIQFKLERLVVFLCLTQQFHQALQNYNRQYLI